MMKELSLNQVMEVSGGKFKLHFPLVETIFTAIGAAILGGPVGLGIVIGSAIATQGVGNLKDMYDEYGNKVNQ